jgi:hypothetical protein
MSLLVARSRRVVPAFIAALAFGVAGCGEKDVESGASQGAEKAKEAGKDAAGEAEKRAKEAKRDAEQ